MSPLPAACPHGGHSVAEFEHDEVQRECDESVTRENDMWTSIGLANRLKKLNELMWDALVEKRQHITILADGQPLAEIDWDYRKDAL